MELKIIEKSPELARIILEEEKKKEEDGKKRIFVTKQLI